MTQERIMFEIYREREFNRSYRVVYFTELNEHNREHEINRAMSGEAFFDGYIAERSLHEAKAAIDAVLGRLNSGERISAMDASAELQEFLAP